MRKGQGREGSKGAPGSLRPGKMALRAGERAGCSRALPKPRSKHEPEGKEVGERTGPREEEKIGPVAVGEMAKKLAQSLRSGIWIGIDEGRN